MSRVMPLMTSVVPSEETQDPGSDAPDASCAAVPSVAPAKTGIPAVKPVSSAQI